MAMAQHEPAGPDRASYPIRFPDVPYDPEDSALVIIDMQRYYLDPAGPIGTRLRAEFPRLFAEFYRAAQETVIPNLHRILTLYRAADLPIVHVTTGAQRLDRGDLLPHIRRRFEDSTGAAVAATGLDPVSTWREVVAELAPRPGEVVLNKVTRSAFTSTGLDSTLRSLQVRSLLLGGIASDGCVHLTALDASDRGYWTYVLADASAAFDPAMHRSAVEHFHRLWGTAVTTDEVADRLASITTTDRAPATT
ncbi:pyrimidine utilization protein B [Streptomyces sp. AA4]|nr:pyrimidine utilization protein B [Streptomyces sp. AA4]